MNRNRLGIKNPQDLLPFRVVYWDGVEEKYGAANINKFIVRFHSKASLAKLRKDPSLGFAEGYMRGEIEVSFSTVSDLRDLVRVFYKAEFNLSALIKMLPSLVRRWFKTYFWFNTKKLAGKNAQAHYDLPPQLYTNMLDAGMNYSCAMPGERDSLAEAQLNKNRIICEKLRLQSGDVVLDIGCGWGGLMSYIVNNYHNVEVYGITLSLEQYASVCEEIKYNKKNDDSQWYVYLADYRQILKTFPAKTFTKIVSVGMFEHVGHRCWQKFCDICFVLLKKGGTLLLHTITKETRDLPDSFTMKYIFPGGEIPYDKSVFTCLDRAGFQLHLIHYFGLFYAWTLNQWRINFYATWEERIKPYIKNMDPEEFKKMWDFYLSSAQISFETENLTVMQITAAKGVPIESSQLAK